MIFIKTDDLKKGMRLAKPIYNKNGVMLYERDSKLTSQGIVAVKNFGLIGVYVLEPAEPLPPMSEEDIEFERFQAMSIFTVKEILDEVSKRKHPEKLESYAYQVIKNYGNLDHSINFVQNIRSTEDYVYKHTINTAILCAMIAHQVGLSEKSQLAVVEAALLHDLGTLLIPVGLRKKDPLDITMEDLKKIRTYYYAVFQMFQKDYDMETEVKKILTASILQFHDLGGDTEEQQKAVYHSTGLEVLHVAYAYDNMTAMHLDEEPYSEMAAFRFLMDEQNGFDQDVVNGLIASISILQPGACVELTNGERGLVVFANKGDVLAPGILTFKDNVIYDMSDPAVASEIQIKDIMRTMDNRHVVDKDLLKQYMGKPLHASN